MGTVKMDAAPTKTQAGKGAVARLVKGRGGVEKHRGRRFPRQVAAGVGRGGKNLSSDRSVMMNSSTSRA